MKISVITVSYNAAPRIGRTIRSVIGQDYSDYEYIIVDGNSNDGTVDVIQKYEKYISRWISESDTGIYNAMNKGVGMAKGEYCIFLNAGDMFYSQTVLSKVSGYLDGETSVVMGNQIYLKSDGRFSSYGRHWDSITERKLYFDSLYHQACFIRRSDLLAVPYDESLRMVSDWKEMLILFLDKKSRYLGIDVDIDFFFQDGLTSTNKTLGIQERKKVQEQYFSIEHQIQFNHELKNYKSLLNISRYINHILAFWFQLWKRLTVKRPFNFMTER